jgi:NAD(P)-dependent dehydrogenase (short-subunit alcohol dehydrogenase family)
MAPAKQRFVHLLEALPLSCSPVEYVLGMPNEAADQVSLQTKESVPLKRIGQPEETAKAVAFLAIDATYTAGAEFPVDGGWFQF